MDKALRTTLIIIGVLIIGALLLGAGMLIGRNAWGSAGFWPGRMMAGYPTDQRGYAQTPFGYGMHPGMMGSFAESDPERSFYPHGMAGSGMHHHHQGRGMGAGMMGGYGGGLFDQAEPLSLDSARDAVEDYLAAWENDQDLEIAEIMIFENHAYAQIVEVSTGIGAMEVLVDPATLAVYPEHGPNMMWNLKYGMMSGTEGMGMMGGHGRPHHDAVEDMMAGYAPEEISADMPVTTSEAVETAQRYLDEFLPGSQADEHADPFYGYYTLHVLREGEVVGMLSVNGYNRQVFPHTWHGDFVEMGEAH